MRLRTGLWLAGLALAASSGAAGVAEPKHELTLPCWSIDPGVPPICQAIKELGRYDSAARGPVIDGKPTTEVIVEPSWGTNFRQRSVALLQDDRGRFRLLWIHPAYYFSGFPNQNTKETIFLWRYSPDGKAIVVTGTTGTGPPSAAAQTDPQLKRRKLQTETYRFSARARQFVAVSGAEPDRNVPTRARDDFSAMVKSGILKESPYNDRDRK